MWATFKALTLGTKLAIVGGILAILIALLGSTAYISYQKGLMVAQNELNRYEIASQRITNTIEKLQRTSDTKIVTEYRDRVAYVDRVVYKTRTVIEQSVPEKYNMTKGWIYVYNQTLTAGEVDPRLAADGIGSGVSDRTALLTIAENNGVCLTNEAQLTSLQDWIRATEKNRAEANK